MMAKLGALSPPGGLDKGNVKAWTDEAIWGHRFRNDQTPWLLLLELLNLCAVRVPATGESGMFPPRPDADPLVGEHESFTYVLPQRLELRHLLFRDHRLDAEDEGLLQDEARWSKWFGEAGPELSFDFDYLRRRFDSFEAFANTTKLLRTLEIEPTRNRRWTSKHLVPLGPATLMADLRERKDGKKDPDRRFFSRGGELVFLMLSRSEYREHVEHLIRTRLLDEESRWNKLAARMQPEGEPLYTGSTHIGYLPKPRHIRYDRLAKDWVGLLRLEKLPADYALEPLMRITGLHVSLYLLECAAKITGDVMRPILLEMISTGANPVRKLSIEQFHAHHHATREALKIWLNSFAETETWRNLPGENTKQQAHRELLDSFGWKGDPLLTPERQLQEMITNSVNNHAGHLGPVATLYLQQVGLAVRRRGAGSWYAPNDAILESLVLANVNEPVELRQFLATLCERYNIVVGPSDAQRAFGEMPVRVEQLSRNLQRFEERMRALGLLHRLSDDCAFVHNPFFEPSEAI